MEVDFTRLWRNDKDHEIYADVKLRFNSGIDSETEELSSVVAILFVDELGRFIEQINCKEPTPWLVMFSPFAYGLKQGEYLLLSSFDKTRFYEDIYDKNPIKDARDAHRKLENKLHSFINEAGSRAI